MATAKREPVAEAILRTLESPNVSDRNLESANVVDVIAEVSTSIRYLAKAILPGTAVPTGDAAGVHVDSLTEAVMGVTAGLVQIADSIRELADAVRAH